MSKNSVALQVDAFCGLLDVFSEAAHYMGGADDHIESAEYEAVVKACRGLLVTLFTNAVTHER